MPKFSLWVLMNVAFLLPFAANAAGTYYTGAAYQPAQARYGQSGTYATSGYNRTNANSTTNATPSVRYNGNYNSSVNYAQSGGRVNQQSTQQKSASQKSSKNGFFINGGITHESAMWKFEMNKIANSILNYNNLAWNVLDLNGGYVFDAGKVKMQIDAGFKYGMQWGESNMTDDDITNGGFVAQEFSDGTYLSGHGLSIGATKDGNMLGFNFGFGLTDFWRVGNVKITPSIGYRYLRYKVETSANKGLMFVASACFSGDGETQCDPAIFGIYNVGTSGDPEYHEQLFWRDNIDDYPAAVFDEAGHTYYTEYIDYGDTYYYSQSGVSHSYETEWSGPYLALDMLYDINQNNSVNGRVEIGFPGYKTTGDQPYRWDWAHPKSVEDSADMFSALHLGLAGNWKTAITNSVSLSIGMTYDYYTVKGANANTYLNQKLYNQLLAQYGGNETAMLDPDTGSKAAIFLNKSRQNCGGGWVCKSSNEVDSVYKSMGIRVGFDAKF